MCIIYMIGYEMNERVIKSYDSINFEAFLVYAENLLKLLLVTLQACLFVK